MSVALTVLAVALGFTTVAAQQCGELIKSITFEGAGRIGDRVPYVQELAYQDFAPYSYLDGFHSDSSTRGTNNERAYAVQQGASRVLEVMLPEGCVTSECAMQSKSLMVMPVDSATLKFRMRFGPNFDWVRGGKLPGLCGARCHTGCKEVSGLDGFSSRQMWRPCVWPPVHELDELNCDGGKLVAYVYHMNKTHWCGDDFEYSNQLWSRIYSTPRTPEVPKDYFQPNPDEWYTVWSHVQMNTAGPPGEPENWKQDGKLQTWMEGPGFGPLLVVDKQEMGWRRYNNVSIDTFYFSVFFGGSSPSFRAKKDETIEFDDFQIWEGKCSPENEPFTQELTLPSPVWDNMRSDLNAPTVLLAEVVGRTAFGGGGCVTFEVLNTADSMCSQFELEINIRPTWGTVLSRDGKPNWQKLTPLEIDEEAGWFKVQSQAEIDIQAGMVDDSAKLCIMNYQQAKYLPADFNSHVVARAVCVAGPAASAEPTVLNPNEVTIDPAPAPDVPSPATEVPIIPGTIDPAPVADWCTTTASQGGVWDLFALVKSKLCSGATGFDKPWGPIIADQVVECPCGQVGLYPDNECVEDSTNSSSC